MSLCLLPALFKWAEYILFASLLVAVVIIFSIMAYFYTYIDPVEIEAQFRKSLIREGDDDDDDDKNKPEAEMVRRDSDVSRDDSDTDSKKDGQTNLWTVKLSIMAIIGLYSQFNINTRENVQ